MKLMDVNATWFEMMKIDREEHGTKFEKLIRNIDIKINNILAFIAYINTCWDEIIIIKTKDKKLYKYQLDGYVEIENSIIDDVWKLEYAYYNEKTLNLKDVIQVEANVEAYDYESYEGRVIFIDMNQFGNDDYLQTVRTEVYKNIDKAINNLLEMKKNVNTFTNNDLLALHLGGLRLEIQETDYYAEFINMDSNMFKYLY